MTVFKSSVTWTTTFRRHTGVGHTDSESAQPFLDSEKLTVFLVLPTGFKPSTFGYIQSNALTSESTRHPTDEYIKKKTNSGGGGGGGGGGGERPVRLVFINVYVHCDVIVSSAASVSLPQWGTADAEMKNPPPGGKLAQGYQRFPLLLVIFPLRV